MIAVPARPRPASKTTAGKCSPCRRLLVRYIYCISLARRTVRPSSLVGLESLEAVLCELYVRAKRVRQILLIKRNYTCTSMTLLVGLVSSPGIPSTRVRTYTSYSLRGEEEEERPNGPAKAHVTADASLRFRKLNRHGIIRAGTELDTSRPVAMRRRSLCSSAG